MKTKTQFTESELAEISLIQEKRNLSRKSAVQFFTRQRKQAAAKQAATVAKKTAPKSGKPEKESKSWGEIHRAECVKLWANGEGKSISEIAKNFGEPTKQNRIRRTLFIAGVYRYKSAAANKAAKALVK